MKLLSWHMNPARKQEAGENSWENCWMFFVWNMDAFRNTQMLVDLTAVAAAGYFYAKR